MKKTLTAIVALSFVLAITGCVMQIGKIETGETAPRATFWRSNDIGGSTNGVSTEMAGGGTLEAKLQ